MLWIHLSDDILRFSKLLPLVRISYFQTFSDNSGSLRENFQSIQRLPGLILRELFELEAKIGCLFLYLFQSSCSMEITKSVLNSFILRGVKIIILSIFIAISMERLRAQTPEF